MGELNHVILAARCGVERMQNRFPAYFPEKMLHFHQTDISYPIQLQGQQLGDGSVRRALLLLSLRRGHTAVNTPAKKC